MPLRRFRRQSPKPPNRKVGKVRPVMSAA
jgi:hypothetical protein